jgi:multidrug transporter EmrE-like cation transporter
MVSFKPVLLFLIAALLGAFGQYFYKTGAESASARIITWILNYRIILGILCYISIMVLFLLAFRIGGPLTILYPVYATTFIWGLLIGIFLLGEKVNPLNFVGVGLIILGIYFIAK